MSDEEAFMQLVLANSQGELSPLEIGMHALEAVEKGKGGRGKNGGLQAYADAVGKDRGNVSRYLMAAKVCESINSCIDTRVLLDKAQHLAAIHKAPMVVWEVLGERLLAEGWSAKDTEYWVRKVLDFEIPEEWQEVFLPYAAVVEQRNR
jgi:hypothetical protein